MAAPIYRPGIPCISMRNLPRIPDLRASGNTWTWNSVCFNSSMMKSMQKHRPVPAISSTVSARAVCLIRIDGHRTGIAVMNWKRRHRGRRPDPSFCCCMVCQTRPTACATWPGPCMKKVRMCLLFVYPVMARHHQGWHGRPGRIWQLRFALP